MMADLEWHDFDQKRHFKKSIVHPTLNLSVQEETSPLSIEEMRLRVRQKTQVKSDSPKKDIAPSLGRKASTVRIDSTGPSRASRELDEL